MISELESLYSNGLISHKYYLESIIKVESKIELYEEKISSIAKNVNNWQTMSHSEKRMYIMQNISKVMIDTVNKEITRE